MERLRAGLIAAVFLVMPFVACAGEDSSRARSQGARAAVEVTSYSSYGMALAGLLVEAVSGQPFEEYLRRHIWEPLGMSRTFITVPSAFGADLATAYELEGAEPVDKEVSSPTYGETNMRFMIIVKASKDSEAGKLPSQELLAAMGKYNEELVKAGILLSGEGLQPSSKGARVRFSGDRRDVIDGPFAETKELIAGYWVWQVESKEEAIEWVKRCPNPMPGTEAEIEIRQVFESEDFGAEFTPELRAQEERVRAQAAQLAQKR